VTPPASAKRNARAGAALAGEVHRPQRELARGSTLTAGTLEPERVGDAPGGDRCRRRERHVAARARRGDDGSTRPVVACYMICRPKKHAVVRCNRVRAAARTAATRSLPRRARAFTPLLRVDDERLARANRREHGIETDQAPSRTRRRGSSLVPRGPGWSGGVVGGPGSQRGSRGKAEEGVGSWEAV